MLVPTRVHHLHKACAAFNKPACHQAIVRECPALFHLRTVKVQHAFGFAGNIRQLRHACLHSVGHLVLRDARENFRVAEFRVAHLVELRKVIEHSTPRAGCDAGRIFQIQNRRTATTKFYSLKPGWQKPTAPIVIIKDLPARRAFAHAGHRHERRQAVVVAAQAVAQPRTHRRPSWHFSPRKEK